MAEKTLLLPLLLPLLLLVESNGATGLQNGRPQPGSLTDVRDDDAHLPQVVLAATRMFNSQSNDMFLFKPSAVRRAQRQIVNGLCYIIDVDVSRTVCRKQDTDVDLDQCHLQPPGNLHQVQKCHAEFWLIPWKNETKTQRFSCKNQENNKELKP